MIKLVLILILFTHSIASAGDYYVCQIAAGSENGSSCANCDAIADLTWGAGNMVAPGDTLHLCGTFTGDANSTMLTIGASGTAEAGVITIKFETDAVFTSPQWHANGAIYGSAKNYITVDGGTNGIIKNTDNGTSKTYTVFSSGVVLSGSNITVQNLTIQDIYQNEGTSSGATDADGRETYGVSVVSNGTGSITIDNNNISGGSRGIVFGMSSNGGDNVTISRNTISDTCWGMYITANTDPNVSISNFNIWGNNISNWTNWQYPAASYHQNGMFISGYKIADSTPINVYGNKIQGLIGGSITASISFTFSPLDSPYTIAANGPGMAANIYNNVLTPDPSTGLGIGNIAMSSNQTFTVYNNTIVGIAGSTAPFALNGGSSLSYYNNMIRDQLMIMSSSDGVYTVTAADYNYYYNITRPTWKWSDGTSTYVTFGPAGTAGTWQNAGFDVNSPVANITTDPLMENAAAYNYKLLSSSPAKNTGCSTVCTVSLDLTSIFTTDYSGVTRDSLWDIGAYEYYALGSSVTPGSGPKATPGSGPKWSPATE